MAKEKSKKRKTKWYPGKLLEAVTGTKKRRLKKAYKAEGAKMPAGPGTSKEDLKKKAETIAGAKEKAKKKAKGAGRVRKGAVGVKSTKGGEYVKYGKKSKAAKSFRSEFAAARKAGKSSFSWDGRSYSTARADDKKKAAPKKIDVRDKVKEIKARNEKASKWEAGKKKGDESLAQLKKEGTYAEGGKVESNPYGWPSKDSRNR